MSKRALSRVLLRLRIGKWFELLQWRRFYTVPKVISLSRLEARLSRHQKFWAKDELVGLSVQRPGEHGAFKADFRGI